MTAIQFDLKGIYIVCTLIDATAKLLLALASSVILGSEFYITHDHILLS
jgi:hypothetical protein